MEKKEVDAIFIFSSLFYSNLTMEPWWNNFWVFISLPNRHDTNDDHVVHGIPPETQQDHCHYEIRIWIGVFNIIVLNESLMSVRVNKWSWSTDSGQGINTECLDSVRYQTGCFATSVGAYHLNEADLFFFILGGIFLNKLLTTFLNPVRSKPLGTGYLEEWTLSRTITRQLRCR